MGIVVKNITKQYGAQIALNNVSFEIQPNEIVGFLGPNGAGKSTMFKILSCYLPQTEGSVTVAGYDVIQNPIQVKKQIGYLPEHNPLYLDMYVKEYLNFMCDLHKIESKKEIVQNIIQKTGLTPEQNKKIGELSKGFRQRVGIAQALIHNPKVLILDEPTTGLDPNQIVEIRNLIKEIAKDKAVILSTHIMQEVEAICDRVIIINKGEIIANATTQEIKSKLQPSNTILIEFDKEVSKTDLLTITEITNLTKTGSVWEITAVSNFDLNTALFNYAVTNKLQVVEMRKSIKNLESVFQELTNN